MRSTEFWTLVPPPEDEESSTKCQNPIFLCLHHIHTTQALAPSRPTPSRPTAATRGLLWDGGWAMEHVEGEGYM